MDEAAKNDNENGSMEASIGPASYEVGYGKPPTKNRFMPGQSGNPKGRRKGAKSTGALLREIFDERIVVREGDREKKIPRKEAWIRKTINDALKGNAKASAIMIGLLREVGQIEPEPANPDENARRLLAEEDDEIMRRYFPDRLRHEGEN